MTPLFSISVDGSADHLPLEVKLLHGSGSDGEGGDDWGGSASRTGDPKSDPDRAFPCLLGIAALSKGAVFAATSDGAAYRLDAGAGHWSHLPPVPGTAAAHRREAEITPEALLEKHYAAAAGQDTSAGDDL